jgi:2-methylcitrate dehydratase PrpD
MSAATTLAAWAGALRYEDLPPTVVRAAQDRLLDTVGVALAGRASDASTIVRARAIAWGGPQEATVFGEDLKVPTPMAALVNGTYSHALDFDDTHLPSILHPSAPLVPAVVAQAEARKASGRDLIVALVAGYEVGCRLGMAQYDRTNRRSVFIDRGLHVTSYVGAIGAAVACARLARIDNARIAHALAIASGMGAGLIETSRAGGSAKKFQGGWSAHCGVVAAQVAEDGLTGAMTALEGRFGFFPALIGSDWREEDITDALGERWFTPTISIKPYPCQHFTHGLIDAARALRARGIQPDDVESATLGVASKTVAAVGEPVEAKRRPTTSYLAQFSGPFVFAGALAGGGGLGIAMEDFAQSKLDDPVRQRLAGVCTVVGDPECDRFFPEQFPARVRVTLRNGTNVEEHVMANRGGGEWPLTQDELAVKLKATAGDRAGAIVAAINGLEKAPDVLALIRATRGMLE